MWELPNDRADFAASKVLLRVIQRRLEVFLIPELPIEQVGFRRGRGARDHIANLRWMMEKAREHQRDLYMCFIYTTIGDACVCVCVCTI